MDRYHLAGRAAGVLAAAALLAAGCSSGSGGTGSGSGSGPTGSGGSPPGTSAGSSAGSTTAAGSPLFPIAVGEKWVYAGHLASLGSYTTTNTVQAVKPVAQGRLVTMTDSSTIPGAAGKVSKLTYLFYS